MVAKLEHSFTDIARLIHKVLPLGDRSFLFKRGHSERHVTVTCLRGGATGCSVFDAFYFGEAAPSHA